MMVSINPSKQQIMQKDKFFLSLLKSGQPFAKKKHLIHIKILIYGINSRGITLYGMNKLK
jgi:hypothetical protein